MYSSGDDDGRVISCERDASGNPTFQKLRIQGKPVIFDEGKVGIGTSSPTARLTVEGLAQETYATISATATGTSHAISASAEKVGVYGEAKGDDGARAGVQGVGYESGAYGGMFSTKNDTDCALYTGTGRVGIGGGNPSERLDVNGNARFRSVGSGSYNAPLNITSDGTLTTATSDRSMKKAISRLKGVLGKVTKLRGVNFKWKNDQDDASRIGLVAQEVEKVFPELVFINPTDGYKGIRFGELTAVLIEAIKEQQSRITSLEKKLAVRKA